MTCCGYTKDGVKKRFKPDFNGKALTEKFYARHDRLTYDPNHNESYHRYTEEIQKRRAADLHSILLAPRTENQVYGWLQHLADKYEADYERMLFHRARVTDEAMRIQMEINLAASRGVKR